MKYIFHMMANGSINARIAINLVQRNIILLESRFMKMYKLRPGELQAVLVRKSLSGTAKKSLA